jgi:excisionase family DNA binding protein
MAHQLRADELQAVVAAARLASQAGQEAFLHTLTTNPTGLDPALWGPPPAVHGRALQLLTMELVALRSMARDCMTTTEAAELLGTTAQAIRRLLRTRRLVGLRMSGRWLLPTWQFTPLAEADVVPDLAPLQEAFPGDAIMLSAWVVRDNVELDGRSPVDALLDGDTEAVIGAARGVTAAAF